MKLKFGKSIFMKSRMYPIKAIIKPISDYPIKFKVSKVPNISKLFEISCFNLDEFRKERNKNEIEKIELE